MYNCNYLLYICNSIEVLSNVIHFFILIYVSKKLIVLITNYQILSISYLKCITDPLDSVPTLSRLIPTLDLVFKLFLLRGFVSPLVVSFVSQIRE